MHVLFTSMSAQRHIVLCEQILSMPTPANLIRRLDELLAGGSHRQPLNVTVAGAAGA